MQPSPIQLWSGTVNSGTYRLIDLGANISDRFVIEKLVDHDTLGSAVWRRLDIPFADALQAAFIAIAKV